MKALYLLAVSFAISSTTLAQDISPVMSARDLMQIPVEKPDQILKYGNDKSQFGELRLPSGSGTHPVVVLIHGGCWRSYAGTMSIGAMADALKKKGIATWSIEYRRLPDAGSGWPGTYQDAAQAIDYLRTLAPKYRLDLRRVVFVGHSAGGHLAHWAAARSKLKPSSLLYSPDPLKPAGVINLAGRMDMSEGVAAYEATCGEPVVRQLLGGMPEDVPERYAETSPSALLPLNVKQVMIWGSREEYVPQSQAERYVAMATKAGDQVHLIVVPGAGHFETASPFTSAWPTVLLSIETLLGR